MSFLYAAVTRWRRQAVEPRQLSRPVVSIGNLASGGRGKTPMAAAAAHVLLDAGERPSILSRGYARARAVDTPVVVRDAGAIRASLAESGDEPLMLAEQLDGAIVVVCPDRARAGVVAEQLGATVHILDDGFQHLRVARDVDIVMMEPQDLGDAVIPAGRLREPIDALEHADAIVMMEDDEEGREKAAAALREIPGVRVFTAMRRVVPPPVDLAASRGFLVSGLADNAQFAWAAAESGWRIAGHASYKDHYRYSSDDAARVARGARAAGAEFVLTTAKDAVRLRELWVDEMPLHIADLVIDIDEREAFDRWLIERVAEARSSRAEDTHRARIEGPRRAS